MEKAAILGSLAARAVPALGRGFSGLGAAARRASTYAAPALERGGAAASGLLRRAPRQLGELTRFVAGVPEGQSFAPTIRKGLGNVGRLLASPRYPGLDRPPGMTAMARPLDRTRAALGTVLRRGSWGATALSGAAGANTLLRGYPDLVADSLNDVMGVERSDLRAASRVAARAEAPRIYTELGLQTIGLGDRRPLSRYIGGIARQNLVPQLRYNLHATRTMRPGLMAVVDGLRSTTPAGMAATWAIRRAGSPEPPYLSFSAQRQLPSFLRDLSRDPGNVAAGPFYEAFRRVVPDARHIRARIMARNVMHGLGVSHNPVYNAVNPVVRFGEPWEPTLTDPSLASLLPRGR